MPLQISGRCVAHSNEMATDLCATCGDEYCAGCLVGTMSSRRSLCVGCALAAAGVRSSARKSTKTIGGRELRRRRDESERIRADVQASHDAVDRFSWQLVESSIRLTKTPSRIEVTGPRPAAVAVERVASPSDLDPALTAGGFTVRAHATAQNPPAREHSYPSTTPETSGPWGASSDGPDRLAVPRPPAEGYRPGSWSAPPGLAESSRPPIASGATSLRAPRFIDRSGPASAPTAGREPDETGEWASYFSDR